MGLIVFKVRIRRQAPTENTDKAIERIKKRGYVEESNPGRMRFQRKYAIPIKMLQNKLTLIRTRRFFLGTSEILTAIFQIIILFHANKADGIEKEQLSYRN